MKDDCCERCERLIAELRAEQRAECNQLREGLVRPIEGLVRRVDEIFDQTQAAVADAGARNHVLMADIDRRMRRLLATLSETLLLLPQRTDEEPPRPH
jgi:hypothetical protein